MNRGIVRHGRAAGMGHRWPLLLVVMLLLVPALSVVTQAGSLRDEAVIHPTGGTLMDFWLPAAQTGNIWVGDNVVIDIRAKYGKVTKEMMWDTAGNLMGGYTEIAAEDVPLSEPVTITVERYDEETRLWSAAPSKAYSLSASGTRRSIVFGEQGFYRYKAALQPTVPVVFPRMVPRYSVVLSVYDKRHNRSRGITGLRVELPPPFAGIGIAIDGQSSRTGSKTPCLETYVHMAKAQESVIHWESGTQRSSTPSEWHTFQHAQWSLKADEAVITSSSGQGFDFKPRTYGDGNYILEAALPPELQGQGIQNLRVPPAQVTITVRNCGEGSFWKSEAGEQAKKKKQGETVGVPAEAVEEISVDGLNTMGEEQKLVLVPHVEVAQDLAEPGPVPINLDQCDSVEKEIAKRRARLKTPCGPAVRLMTDLLKGPEGYHEKGKEFAVIWGETLEKIQKAYQPFTALIADYKAFLEKAGKAGAIISADVLAREQRRSSFGTAPIRGDGFPEGMFEDNPARMARIRELDAEQKKIGSAWGKALGTFSNGLKELNASIKKTNESLETKYKDLDEFRKAHGKKKDALSEMFYSGNYEHCLGYANLGQYVSLPVEQAKAMGLISDMPAGVKFVAIPESAASSLGLPGMNITLPAAEKRTMPEIKDVPKPLKLARLKMDGAVWLKRGREIVQAAYEEEELKAYAKHGTFLNWFGDTIFNKLGMGALDAGMLDGLADPNLSWYEKMFEGTKGTGATLGFMLKDRILPMLGDAAMGIKYDIFDRPISERSKTGNVLFGITEAIGMDIAQVLRGGGKALGLLEDEFEGNPFEGLGDNPRDNLLAMNQGLDQIRWLKENNEEIDGATNVLIDALGAEAAELAKTARAQGLIAKADKLTSLATAFRAGSDALKAAGKKIDDIFEARRIADELDELGKTIELTAEEKLARNAFNETVINGERIAKEAVANQAVKEVLEKAAVKEAETAVKPVVKPKDLPAVDAAKIEKKLGEGQMGIVYENPANPNEILKVMKLKGVSAGDMSKLPQVLDELKDGIKREVKGSELLQEAGLEHCKINGVGTAKTNVGGVEVEVPCMTKDMIGKGKKIDGEIMDNLIKNKDPAFVRSDGSLQDDVQRAIIEYVHNANKKGILIGDFKPDNLYVRKKAGGGWEVGMVETDGIAKVTSEMLRPGETLASHAKDLQFGQLTGKIKIGDNAFPNAEWAGEAVRQVTKVGSSGGFKDLLDQKHLDLLQDGKLLDEMIDNKAVKALQDNPASALTGQRLAEYEALAAKSKQALDQVEANGKALEEAARKLRETGTPVIEEAKKKGGGTLKKRPDPDLEGGPNILEQEGDPLKIPDINFFISRFDPVPWIPGQARDDGRRFGTSCAAVELLLAA